MVTRPKRRRYGAHLGEISPAPEDLLNRDFTAVAPDEKWLIPPFEDVIGVAKSDLGCCGGLN